MMPKECPACAMEIHEKSTTCPVCGYEFAGNNLATTWIAVLLALIFLTSLILGFFMLL